MTGLEESIANLGRTAAAGWFPVRGLVSPVIQTPQSGSVVRVEADRIPLPRYPCRAKSLQGSGDIVRCPGGAGHDDDERADEFHRSRRRAGVRGEREKGATRLAATLA